jgi:hypothetical protein
MRPERPAVGMFIKIALIIIISCLFYVMAVLKEKPAPQRAGARGVIQRALDAFRRTFHLKSPHMSESELREKARRYLE